MSSSEALAPVHVRSVGGPVRITLLDHNFRLVGEPSVGKLETKVKPGLYLLQYDTGWFSEQVPVKIQVPKGYENLELRVPFSCAAPIPGTSGFRPNQAEKAQWLSMHPDPAAKLGTGGRLMLFVRQTKDGSTAAPSLVALTLLDGAPRPLPVSLGAGPSSAEHGWAGWCADATPGCYLLQWQAESPAAPAVDQALWVADEWTTLVFMTARDDSSLPNIEDVTIHLVHWKSGFLPFARESADVQLAMELALAGWRTEKPLVDESSLFRMLDEKSGNPMLGIVAAHLLLQETNPDEELIAQVLDLLERLIPTCPDVRALRGIVRLRFQLSGSILLLDWPPMFRASFKGVVASDWEGRGVISPGSLADRVASRLVPLSPWTTWLALPPESTSAANTSCLMAPETRPASDPEAEADFLGGWLRRVLPQLPLAEMVIQVFGRDWQATASRELWRRFAAWPDPAVQKLTAQLQEMYRFVEETGGLDVLDNMDLAGVAQALSLPQTSVATAVIQLATDLLAHAGTEVSPMKDQGAGDWPPENGPAFIRSEAFGSLLLLVVEQLARQYPDRDFSDGAAHVFSWFDRKLKQNRRFINSRRFPTGDAFRAYLRQSLWNVARMADRSRRKGKPLRALPAEQEPVFATLTPQQTAILHESLEALPEPHKSILEQFFIEEKDLDLIASFWDKPRQEIVRLYEEAIDRLALEQTAPGGGFL